MNPKPTLNTSQTNTMITSIETIQTQHPCALTYILHVHKHACCALHTPWVPHWTCSIACENRYCHSALTIEEIDKRHLKNDQISQTMETSLKTIKKSMKTIQTSLKTMEQLVKTKMLQIPSKICVFSSPNLRFELANSMHMRDFSSKMPQIARKWEMLGPKCSK